MKNHEEPWRRVQEEPVLVPQRFFQWTGLKWSILKNILQKIKESFSTIKNLCGTKQGSSMASLQKHLCEAFIFKSVLIVKMAYSEKYHIFKA